MNVPLTGVYIQGEGFHRIENKEDFAQLLEEKLGQDAADMFKQLQPPDPEDDCCECDRVYELEHAIGNAVEELDALELNGSADVIIQRAINLLEEVMP